MRCAIFRIRQIYFTILFTALTNNTLWHHIKSFCCTYMTYCRLNRTKHKHNATDTLCILGDRNTFYIIWTTKITALLVFIVRLRLKFSILHLMLKIHSRTVWSMLTDIFLSFIIMCTMQVLCRNNHAVQFLIVIDFAPFYHILYSSVWNFYTFL